MLDEIGAGPIDHFKHQIESVGTPVVGIRYIEVSIRMRVELSEEGEESASVRLGLQVAKVSEIATIHGEDIVELVEVFGAYAPRSPPERDPVPHRDVGGAWVGRLSLVPRPRSC